MLLDPNRKCGGVCVHNKKHITCHEEKGGRAEEKSSHTGLVPIKHLK